MPNGGSDCCGTCWFNDRNKGNAGYPKGAPPSPIRCVIRDITVTNTFWTYCANHPHHNPDRIETPVGPVYECAEGHPHERKPCHPSPDTPEVRAALIRLLEAIPEQPREEYPSGTEFDGELIRQLGAFRERGACPGLRRILAFDPDIRSGEKEKPFTRDRRLTIGRAIEALAEIVGDDALPDIERLIAFGMDLGDAAAKDYGVIRFFAVRALAHCSRDRAVPLWEPRKQDPDSQVAVLAGKMLASS